MDNQWHHHHHHQSVQGNICPTCSKFHYPFCPPHSSMNQNPRYLPPQDLPFHASEPYRLPPDPYRHPHDGYRDPMLLNKSPGLDRNSHGNGVAPLRYDYSNSSDLASGGDRNIKRIRVGDMDSGRAVDDFGGNLSRVMMEEDERRLNLIRNHGGASMPGTSIGLNQETGFGEHGIMNGNRENRGENTFNSAATMGMGDLRDPGFGSKDRRGPPLPPSSVLSSHGYGEVHSLTYGRQSMQTNRSEHDGFPVGMGNQHHEGMVRDVADRGQRYHWNSPQGNFNKNPLLSQQGPSPIREVLMERNGFKSNSPYNEHMVYNDQPLGPYKLQHPMHNEYDFQSPSVLNDTRQSSQVNFPSREVNHFPYNNINYQSYLPMNGGQPPLPRSPPPPLPVEAPYDTSFELKTVYKLHLSQPNLPNKSHFAVSTGFAPERHLGEGQLFPLQPSSADKRNRIDASHLFKQPHRATRPDHIVIILRGLPGSGKSYLAKMFRDLEIENGGGAPRIHSIDDYFMTEVEKVDENGLEKSTRGKKRTMKKVMEYCYEPEMEEAYRSSMLKAFKKTLDEGVFTFIIVDDRNLRVADFAQFWAIAKRSGYEAYLLEATYKDPVGCAARNVHGFTQDDIQKMAKLWEEAPSWYLELDVKSLFHGDNLKDDGIQEVDMDTEDRDLDESLSGSECEKPENADVSVKGGHATGSLKDEERKDGAEGDHPTEQIKELGKSKWSDDFEEDDANRTQCAQRKTNSLSGLIQAYAKDGKSVQWGDQTGNTGFTIGVAKKAKVLSLVIGPGAGYNMKSNPLPEVNPTSTPNTNEKHSLFQQQLRAERESFKAIFDRRMHRIALDPDEE